MKKGTTKYDTPEKVATRDEARNKWHREWRKKNPKKQAAIVLRAAKKKVAEAEKAFGTDLVSIRAELKEG